MCLSLQLDLLFTPCMTFSHVLQKNATVVVQTDLSLPRFLFLLHFGARISCGFSIAWSPFFLSAGHLWDITHLLHLLMILFSNSCGTFFFWVFCVLFVWNTIAIIPCQQRMECIGFNSESKSSFISRHHIRQTNSYLL